LFLQGPDNLELGAMMGGIVMGFADKYKFDSHEVGDHHRQTRGRSVGKPIDVGQDAARREKDETSQKEREAQCMPEVLFHCGGSKTGFIELAE